MASPPPTGVGFTWALRDTGSSISLREGASSLIRPVNRTVDTSTIIDSIGRDIEVRPKTRKKELVYYISFSYFFIINQALSLDSESAL